MRGLAVLIFTIWYCIASTDDAAAQQQNPVNSACIKREFAAAGEAKPLTAGMLKTISPATYDSIFAGIRQIQQSVPENVIFLDSLISFRCGPKVIEYRNSATDWYGYGGFLKEPGLHFITHADVKTSKVDNRMIDDATGEIYVLTCPHDYGYAMLPPVNSGNMLLFFGFNPLINESVLTAFEIDDDAKQYCLKKIATHTFDQLRINEISDTGLGYAILFGEQIKKDNTTQPQSSRSFHYYKITWHP